MKSNIFYEVVGKNIRKYREIRGYSLQLLGDRVGLTKKLFNDMRAVILRLT
ncbi:repressor-like domain protein [Paenibacillus phage Tripp]|uniref:Repressor-like domain protein n=1 Tax=Paenibacillus phage Tripp TaxID=1718161 RepID=A0A0N9SJU6_9CAUD|nr:repressor-like domain protein [Paenibacillus phage Tripp]ALH46407.1 repressor-like domain protein [Paenibacillus phage Tripp]